MIFDHTTRASVVDLLATLDRYADAGIDPVFDAYLEELERQFAELRLCHHKAE